VTTIAALQNVENGLLQLDTDVGEVVPELKSPMILKGFKEDGNEPILEPAKSYITLRFVENHRPVVRQNKMLTHLISQLLTHQSGLEYPGEDNLIGKYLKLRGKEPSLRNSVVCGLSICF
jgi:CubicO group peptidase (beta-lactamase class C family)